MFALWLAGITLSVVASVASVAPASAHLAAPTVSQCRDVTLAASFLAESKPGQGSGFFLSIHNGRSTPIAVPQPAPLSVHWYAATPSGRWMWRASSGEGGSLVNALAEHGPLFAYVRPAQSPAPALHQIAPHQTYSWSAFSGDTPALRYRPGCEHCTYRGESQFRAVVAYAYVPASSDEAQDLLRCGLRSSPVVMPPLSVQPPAYNSPAR